jgi:hypothetical protein
MGAAHGNAQPSASLSIAWNIPLFPTKTVRSSFARPSLVVVSWNIEQLPAKAQRKAQKCNTDAYDIYDLICADHNDHNHLRCILFCAFAGNKKRQPLKTAFIINFKISYNP